MGAMALTVRVEQDPGHPMGHARLVLGGTTLAAASGGFRIMREGFAKPNLGPSGWDVTRSDLKPVSVAQEGAQFVLVVGPSVVRHMMKPLMTKKISTPAAPISKSSRAH